MSPKLTIALKEENEWSVWIQKHQQISLEITSSFQLGHDSVELPSDAHLTDSNSPYDSNVRLCGRTKKRWWMGVSFRPIFNHDFCYFCLSSTLTSITMCPHPPQSTPTSKHPVLLNRISLGSTPAYTSSLMVKMNCGNAARA